MKQEDKNILLKYLCMALPYGVKIELTWWVMGEGTYINTTLEPDHIEQLLNDEDCDTEIKPHLRPMLSMTEEEKRHISKMMCLRTYDNGVVYDMTYPVYTPYYVMEDCLSYLCSIHVDYSGLIDKGLAIEVTKENNPYESNM